MDTGEVIYEKKNSFRLPPKISLNHDWMKGSEVARQPEGEVARQPEGEVARPVVCQERALRSQEIETRSTREEDVNHDRTGRPTVCSPSVGSSSTFNEVDIDFSISGLPHSVANQAENSLVRELVKKIENHFHRQDLQAYLQKKPTTHLVRCPRK